MSGDSYEVFVMPGDGIGKEIIPAAVALLERVIRVGRLATSITEFEVGDAAFAATGLHLPDEVRLRLDGASQSPRAAILFGACTNEPIGILRKRYDLFANLRPILPFPELIGVSALRPEAVSGVDMVIVRELVSDIYYGPASTGVSDGERWAAQQMCYREGEVRRILRFALRLASERRGHLTWVHKRNVIKGIFDLWGDILEQEQQAFPTVRIEDFLVDNMAMQMMLRPRHFDVIVTTNLFGDILSEVGAGIIGSLGLVPSLSLNGAGFALYEPVGGTAPDIAGRQLANPIAAILSVALLCQHTFKRPDLAQLIHRAVANILTYYRTADIAQPGCATVSTHEIGARIATAFDAYASQGA